MNKKIYILKHINTLLDIFETQKRSFPLDYKEQKCFGLLPRFTSNQKKMYDENSHSCKDRIVSIFQPHVRLFVRGKYKVKVEFG